MLRFIAASVMCMACVALGFSAAVLVGRDKVTLSDVSRDVAAIRVSLEIIQKQQIARPETELEAIKAAQIALANSIGSR